VCFRLKKETRVALPGKPTEKTAARGKGRAKPGILIDRTGREIPKSVMSERVVDLPPEVRVKASQQFQDPELVRRSQAGDTEAFGELVTKYTIFPQGVKMALGMLN